MTLIVSYQPGAALPAMSGLPFLSLGQQTPGQRHRFGALPRQSVVVFRLGDVVARAVVVFFMHAATDGQQAGGDTGIFGIINGRIGPDGVPEAMCGERDFKFPAGAIPKGCGQA